MRPVLEEVNDADGGIGALDAGLDQREIRGVERLVHDATVAAAMMGSFTPEGKLGAFCRPVALAAH